MSKGEQTRQAILSHATAQATQLGLEALSIGRLASDLELSKSGLFAHFQSKEALQIAVVERAALRFTEQVVRPALRAPRGEPRVRALIDAWMAWGVNAETPGGCFFVAASAEFDDRPGPVRDAIVQSQRDWVELLGGAVRAAVVEGHFAADTDPDQVAFELYGCVLSFHHRSRLLGEADAAVRLRAAVARVLSSARTSA